MLACFSRIIEHDKCHGTIQKDPQSALPITVELLRSILYYLRGC